MTTDMFGNVTDVPLPEAPITVDAVQVPGRVATQWSWDTNKLVIAACIVLAVGFGVWFIMSYTSAKAEFANAGNAGHEH